MTIDDLKKKLHETQNCIIQVMRNKSLALSGLANMNTIKSYNLIIEALGRDEQTIQDEITKLGNRTE